MRSIICKDVEIGINKLDGEEFCDEKLNCKEPKIIEESDEKEL